MDKDKFYIGEDGLEHCVVCQEPVEKKLPEHMQAVFGMKTHPRQCACMRAQIEKEKQERKEREHQQEVEKNTTICFPERAMREWNFANDDGSNPHMKYAKQYVPQVYHYDENMCTLIMEDISQYKNLRKELMDCKTFTCLSDDITSFLVDTLLPTTDLVMDRATKKEYVKLFTNIELCDISEDLVFTEPYYDYKGRNIIIDENKEFVKEFLYENDNLKKEVAHRKLYYI